MVDEDEDPFSVFSDDDDEEEDSNVDVNVDGSDTGVPEKGNFSAGTDDSIRSSIAKALVDQANEKLQTQSAVGGDNVPTGTPVDGAQSSTKPASTDSTPFTWHQHHHHPMELDWPKPAYLGPMILVSDLEVGGGRGYVASQPLEPGTLVLVEEPAMTWPVEQLGQKLSLLSVKHLLQQPNAANLVGDLELFHPTKDNVDNHAEENQNKEQIFKMMEAIRMECDEEQMTELVRLGTERQITCRDGSPLTSKDVLRLLIALRYNGLESGVYRHVAMFNHDCHPNCTKLRPDGDQSYSEVRTTRRIDAGEALTISYVPHILSHASRRKHLWEQHRFDIGAKLRGHALQMELIGNDLPKSHVHQWEDDCITHRVESTTAELEKMLEDLQEDITTGDSGGEAWETLKALEQTAIELYQESTQQLKNQYHILLIPILVIHIETCEQLYKAPSLTTPVHLGVLSRQVLSIYRLIPLQILNAGPDHFDLARSNLDLADGIRELLSRSPQHLFHLNLESLTNFQQWSATENRARQEHKRLKDLYPHDAEGFILGTNG